MQLKEKRNPTRLDRNIRAAAAAAARISKQVRSFSYDTDGNVIAALGGQHPPLTDQAEYTYGSSGQRSKKTVDTAQTVISHFDQSGQLIAETDTTGTMIKAYIWLHGQPLAQITPDGSVYYYHNDHLGTPQRITDASGAIVWAADYLPFGKADVIIGTVENNLRFAGQYYDSETGLHYNWNRYYDPSIGRYLRTDPIGLEGGINHYVYVDNNPNIHTDPFGLRKYTLTDTIRNSALLFTSYTSHIDIIMDTTACTASIGNIYDTGVVSGPLLRTTTIASIFEETIISEEDCCKKDGSKGKRIKKSISVKASILFEGIFKIGVSLSGPTKYFSHTLTCDCK